MAKIKSMTAYGRASQSSSVGTITVEIKSVNRKHLDVKVASPASLKEFDVEIQRWVSGCVKRGHLSININFLPGGKSTVSLHLNLGLAKQLKEAGETLAEALHLSDPHFSSKLIAYYKDHYILLEDRVESSDIYETLKETVLSALDQLDLMKSSEGRCLAQDIEERIQLLETKIQEIEKEVNGTVGKRREKLKEILEEALPGIDHEDALMREVCLYAEKVDIEEEITRFRSHLHHFRITLEEEGAVGKKLEFIIQELFREVSTIASKSPEVAVKRLTIEMRGEIERIREQVQNIE